MRSSYAEIRRTIGLTRTRSGYPSRCTFQVVIHNVKAFQSHLFVDVIDNRDKTELDIVCQVKYGPGQIT